MKLKTLFLLCFFLFFIVQPGHAQQDEIVLLSVEGPVTPAMATYFERGIGEAEALGAPAVIITLDTPGGGLDTTQEIMQLFLSARVPVIVYVGPAGAQAASAGSLITFAAHAAAMAPETVIGAASPVGGSGEDIGETLYRKVVEDTKAQVRSLVARRGDEAVTIAEAMIEDARAIHAAEALEIGLIDTVGPDVYTVANDLDGLTVTVDEQERTLQIAGKPFRTMSMNFVERALHALSNPTLLSILLAIAVPAILIELKSPGGWVAGFVGVLCLGLAFYGLGQLPVNWFGLGLVLVAFALFLLEVKSPGIGALALVGSLTLLGGLLVLFNSPGSPEFTRISLPSAITITASTSAFFLFIVTMAVRAQRQQPLTGSEGLIGRTGRVRKTMVPAPSGEMRFVGSVTVHGEIWRAKASESLDTDAEVIITGLDGFTLEVAPAIAAPSTEH